MLKQRFDEVTKAQLKTIAKSKPNFKCSNHTRYNPAQGRGYITGNCKGCMEALDAYEAMCNLRISVANYVTKSEKYETTKPRTKKSIGG